MTLFPPFDYYNHLQTCAYKKKERSHRIAALPPVYRQPVTAEDKAILNASIESLVADVHSGKTKPLEVLRAYGKVAVKAQEKANCITEVMIEKAEKDLKTEGAINLKGPLAGIPISLKDSIQVGGYHTSVGYSVYAEKGWIPDEDGDMVKLLKEAGAVPFVKTNLPTTLLSFESNNDVWGRTLNPHSTGYSPGGSTGGESALLALGGSRIGIGSDVAGSVRVPAHWSGIYSLRCSTGRWPRGGMRTSMAGQEGVMAVFSPMTRTLGDLRYFTTAVMKMNLSKVDCSIVPMGWRDDEAEKWEKAEGLTFGVMWDDGVVTPSPACKRALQTVVTALQSAGHTVKPVSPPSPYKALVLASQLLNSDGGDTFSSHFRTGEANDPGAAQIRWYMKLPSLFRYLHYLWVRYVKGDEIWAGLLRNFRHPTTAEQWKLVSQREAYRNEWWSWWNKENIDIMLTVPNATPALPHKAMHNAVSSCGYTFMFNLLDYAAGVIPITKVDPALDQLPKDFKLNKLNGVARGAYMYYDADKMKGLPVGVQVVGRRMEEEKVLAVMGKVESALKKSGQEYKLLSLVD